MTPIVTVIGSLNYDLVTFTTRVPRAGETYQASSFETHIGGKGLNEALAVARLSPKNKVITRMVGKIGTDDFGRNLKQCLLEAKVDVEFLETIEGPSGVAVIMVEEDSGENRILITAGANGHLTMSDEEYEKIFDKSVDGKGGFVVLQNEYPDTCKSISWLKENRPQINIAYNPSPFKPELVTRKLWRMIDFLIVNEGEAQDVAKLLLPDVIFEASIEGFKKMAIEIQKLLNQENIQTVVITMGSKGCIYYTGKEEKPSFVKAQKVDKVVDTTGAGDTFFGGVVSNLALGYDISKAISFATIASSLAIQKKGAAEGIPIYSEVIEKLHGVK
ncbi:RBK1 [Candida oxycetoniae]|uniref:Ribokinase n=1 Tax=Candida oxycetoniae TaxID=497107 RepID=A0AAI9WW99_9ASCO|nr:RBK1 [Candida oxycetoniae]KAI3402946.1 RBK1 [Candida oxycetoniae]